MRIGVKVEKPDNYNRSKARNLDTWLFQVREYLKLMVNLERGHIPYATSLLRGNAGLWWLDLCESNNRPTTWDEFCCVLQEQFRLDNYNRHGRDELAIIHQYNKKYVADFVFHFCPTCSKIADLAKAEKLDRLYVHSSQR